MRGVKLMEKKGRVEKEGKEQSVKRSLKYYVRLFVLVDILCCCCALFPFFHFLSCLSFLHAGNVVFSLIVLFLYFH